MSVQDFQSAIENNALPVEFEIDLFDEQKAIDACARLCSAEYTTVRHGSHLRASGKRRSGKSDLGWFDA